MCHPFEKVEEGEEERGLRDAGREFVDLVGAETAPVVFVGDDDGRLQVAERLDGLKGLLVDLEVKDFVFNALVVQGTVGSCALHAGRLGVNGDCHRWKAFLRFCRCSNTTSSDACEEEALDAVITIMSLSTDIPPIINRGPRKRRAVFRGTRGVIHRLGFSKFSACGNSVHMSRRVARVVPRTQKTGPPPQTGDGPAETNSVN
jgi:hypothetical protein